LERAGGSGKPEPDEPKPAVGRRRLYGRRLGLSGKLLLLTVAFIMIAEVLVFVPSVSNFRKNWLQERLAAAQIAAVAVDALSGRELPDRVRDELLQSAQVHGIAFRRDESRRLIMHTKMPETIDGHYNLLTAHPMRMIFDALSVYTAPSGRFVRVVGQPGFGPGRFIEIVISEDPLKAAMIRFGLNILGLSIIISVIAAALVYLAINAMTIGPITRLTRNLERFGEDPEDPGRQLIPSSRRDEIGTAERELAHMQKELAGTLQQKSRLAALGLAVSKINHDLRNILASAQLLSDRLGGVNDPTVQRVTPKLIASLDRAIQLCTDTLKFGRAREAPPERQSIPLLPLVREVGDSLGLPREGEIAWRVDVDTKLAIDADPGQLFRVLSNLVRNACQAFEQQENSVGGEVRLSAWREGGVVTIEVSDDGPGVSPRAQEHLFEAFQGSARKGGTGLGLAIASELVRAHGGAIEHVTTGQGATFRLTVPDRVVDLAEERARA
jgi:signal transduction histidine kinase